MLIRSKVAGKETPGQFFSIKGCQASVKLVLQFHLQDKGIKYLADIEVVLKDNGSGSAADGRAIIGVNGPDLPA
jgi:hypothetical protein